MPGKEDQVNNIPRKEQKVVSINVSRANELINNFSSREVIRRKSAVQRKILESIMKNRSNVQSFFFSYVLIYAVKISFRIKILRIFNFKPNISKSIQKNFNYTKNQTKEF